MELPVIGKNEKQKEVWLGERLATLAITHEKKRAMTGFRELV